MGENRDFWLLEYEKAVDQLARATGLYVQTFLIYVGILGVLLKFALDSASTPFLRTIMAGFGIAVCILMGALIEILKRTVTTLAKKRSEALGELLGGHRYVRDEFGIVTVGTWLAFGFNVLAVVGWLLVLFLGNGEQFHG
jgi:hypothetical protein